MQSRDSACSTDSKPVSGQLQPVQHVLPGDGKASEDTLTGIARHWHECYRLHQPAAPGEAGAQNRKRWAELDELIRQDIILQLRCVMAAVVATGRRWVPSRAVAPGSFIELTDRELQEVTRAGHTRWYQRRRPAGRRPAGSQKGGRSTLVNSEVAPWDELSDEGRQGRIDCVRLQLAQLEAIGLMPSLPAGGADGAAHFRRVGAVRAYQLSTAWPWTDRSGNRMCGNAGDWRVVDDHGDERTVRDPEFRATHDQIADDRWQRKGVVRAWRPREPVTLRTMEGRVTAQPEDWIVEGEHGARWPVKDEQFRRGHRPCKPPGR